MGDIEKEENELEETEEEEEDTPRGIFRKPRGETCPRGHVDWEIINRKNLLIKHCRLCGYEVPFQGEVVR